MSTHSSSSEQSTVTPPSTFEANGPSALERDDVFHLLQNQRRRLVLQYLIENVPATDTEMRAVTEQVAAWENDTTVEKLSSTARQRVYIALYQSHLPKLDETGVIEYDHNRGTIEPRAPLKQLKPYLLTDTSESIEDAKETEDDEEAKVTEETAVATATDTETESKLSWNDYYLGLSVLSLLSVLTVTFQLLPGMSAGSPWLGGIIGIAFGVSALIQRF